MLDFPLLTDDEMTIRTKTSDSYDYLKNVITEKIYNNELTINDLHSLMVGHPLLFSTDTINDITPSTSTIFSSLKIASILEAPAIEAISTSLSLTAFGSGYILGGILKIEHTGKDNIAIYSPLNSRSVVFKKTVNEGASWTDIHTGDTTGIIIDGEAAGVTAHYICYTLDNTPVSISDRGALYRTLCTERT